jgi:hypothetical protein
VRTKGIARMRLLAVTVLALSATLAAPIARAQTYDPNFPICLQTFGRFGNYIDCGYTSMPQCQASARGIAAQCIANPYFAPRDAGKLYHRHHRHAALKK